MTRAPASVECTWTVTVAPGTSLESVTARLQQTGMSVDQILEVIGIIVARGTDALAVRARRIPGVTDVSKDIAVDIGLPESEIS